MLQNDKDVSSRGQSGISRVKSEHPRELTPNESSGAGSSDSESSSSSSSTSSQASEQTFIATIGVKTLICDSPPEMRRPREGRDDESRQQRTSNRQPPPHISSSSALSSNSTSSSSTFKRYRFGLTNHFLTMPDVDEQQQAKVYQKSAELLLGQQASKRNKHSNGSRKYRTPAEDRSQSKHAQQRGGPRAQLHARGGQQHHNARLRANQREHDDSDDCDLSVLPPSSPDANSLLSQGGESHWESPIEQTANTSSQLAHSSSSSEGGGGGDGGRMILNQSDLAHEPRLMSPAGDAGLDAGRCNSKASGHLSHLTSANHHSHHRQPADCYLDPNVYHMQHDGHHHHQQHHQGEKNLGHRSVHSSSVSRRQHQSQLEDAAHAHHEHHMRKKMKLSGDLVSATDDHECASNGLLVRLSSIMYATFLVILGCILHVSELRQKSRNSSDHIYTTIVALLGIFWLLFLQGDLQRYKRYASKFILLESIFNDHHHQQQQGGGQLITRIQSGSSPSPAGHGGLLGLDPSGRSTTSSSASLVNDRMSMNTEVIFKKTAYKMYQQQAASAPQEPPPPPPPPALPISNYKLAMGNPLKYHHSPPPPPPPSSHEPVTPRLVPAYKFLHGKMGANFYLKCGMAAFCFGHVIHEGLRFGQQVYFFATNNAPCRDSAALVAHLVTPLYSFYQLFMMFKYSNLVINRHKVLARFGLMHIIGTCVTFWFRTILEEAFEDFVHKMDYFKAQNKPIIHYLDPTGATQLMQRDHSGKHALPVASSGELAPPNAGLVHWLDSLASLAAAAAAATGAPNNGELPGNGQHAQQVPLMGATNATASSGSSTVQQNLTQLAQSTLLALMSSPMSATITPQLVRHLPDSYHCAQNTLLTTKSMNALPYLYPFTIEYNLLIAAIFLSLYFNIGKLDGGASNSGRQPSHGVDMNTNHRCHLACCRPTTTATTTAAPSVVGFSAPPSPHYSAYHRAGYTVSKQPGSSHLSSGASFVGSQLDLITSSTGSGAASESAATNMSQQLQHHAPTGARYSDKFAGEYKSNFVVNADCHAANKGLFLGFFVLLVTLVTIVIFFVTINKPSHLALGIKINLIQEATLTSLILIVTMAGYRQIMRLNQNPFIKNNITTDDVLMLIPLPFFFIHSLLSIRAETATLYTPHHLTLSETASGSLGISEGISALEAATSVLTLGAGGMTNSNSNSNSNSNNRAQANPRADFMLGLPSGLSNSSTLGANRLQVIARGQLNATNQQQQERSKQPPKMDRYKLMTIVLNLAVMIEVLVQTNFIIDGLRRCSESRYLRFKKPGRELITFAIILNITYWIVATFETKSVEQYKTEIDYYGPLPYMFISHTTLPVMLFYRYHSSVCLAEIWNRAYKLPKRR